MRRVGTPQARSDPRMHRGTPTTTDISMRQQRTFLLRRITKNVEVATKRRFTDAFLFFYKIENCKRKTQLFIDKTLVTWLPLGMLTLRVLRASPYLHLSSPASSSLPSSTFLSSLPHFCPLSPFQVACNTRIIRIIRET